MMLKLKEDTWHGTSLHTYQAMETAFFSFLFCSMGFYINYFEFWFYYYLEPSSSQIRCEKNDIIFLKSFYLSDSILKDSSGLTQWVYFMCIFPKISSAVSFAVFTS